MRVTYCHAFNDLEFLILTSKSFIYQLLHNRVALKEY